MRQDLFLDGGWRNGRTVLMVEISKHSAGSVVMLGSTASWERKANVEYSVQEIARGEVRRCQGGQWLVVIR